MKDIIIEANHVCDNIYDVINDIILDIVYERKKKKISQLELSAKSGVSQPTISRVESFNTIPDMITLVKLLDALDLKLYIQKKQL